MKKLLQVGKNNELASRGSKGVSEAIFLILSFLEKIRGILRSDFSDQSQSWISPSQCF